MSVWMNLQARPVEPIPLGADGGVEIPPVEYWQVNVQKVAAQAFDGTGIKVQWKVADELQEQLWECPRPTIAQTPAGSVLHVFTDVGPLGGKVIIEIDRYGGLQGWLHYPTLAAPYQLNML